MGKKLTDDERSFRQGVGLALAELNRMHDQPTMIKDVLLGFGYTVPMLKRAGVDEYDLKELRKCVR